MPRTPGPCNWELGLKCLASEHLPLKFRKDISSLGAVLPQHALTHNPPHQDGYFCQSLIGLMNVREIFPNGVWISPTQNKSKLFSNLIYRFNTPSQIPRKSCCGYYKTDSTVYNKRQKTQNSQLNIESVCRTKSEDKHHPISRVKTLW